MAKPKKRKPILQRGKGGNFTDSSSHRRFSFKEIAVATESAKMLNSLK